MEIIAEDRLNAEDVRELTERLLHEQLSLQVEGYKITTGMVLNVLLKAGVEKRSIEAVCATDSISIPANGSAWESNPPRPTMRVPPPILKTGEFTGTQPLPVRR